MSAPSIAKLHFSIGQRALALAAIVILAALGVSTIKASNEAVNSSTLLSDIETPAATIIFTQRETLVYATRLAQWSNGGTTRRAVQIARNLLAQRLSVVDSSGKSMGERADENYWNALNRADAIVAAEPAGTLPEIFHPRVNATISPVIDQILAAARDLVVSYQKSVDAEMLADAQSAEQMNRINLTLFYLFLGVGSLFLLWSGRSNFKSLRSARLGIERDRLELEAKIRELENLNIAKNQFISTVNHELRTPLTSIIGYVELLRGREMVKLDAEIDNYLEVVDRNAQILLGLVESALALSKVDSSQKTIILKEVDLLEAIDHALFVLRPASEKRRVRVTLNTDSASDYRVMGDSGLINQVLLNLIANAIKFSKEDSLVEITISNQDQITVAIKDSGIGIPEDDLPHLFTRFYRARNAVNEHYQGSGLGLAIADQVLELHGGQLIVESTLGVGSTFSFTLPTAPSVEELMIAERRADVLNRSLSRLRNATESNLKDLTHEIGGAIGFYGYDALGQEILEYSRALPIKDSYREDLASPRYMALLESAALLQEAPSE